MTDYGKYDARAERWRLSRIAKADLSERQRSVVFRARVWLASLVLGKRNWQVIFRNYVGMACSDPGSAERLLRGHFGSSDTDKEAT